MSKVDFSTPACPQKADIRKDIMERAKIVNPYDHYRRAIMMPSTQLLCFKEGMSQKVFHHSETVFDFAESDCNIVRSMSKNLQNENVKYNIFQDNVFKMRVHPDTTFAFLDLYGTLSAEGIKWLAHDLFPVFRKGGYLALTLNGCFRNCKFSQDCMKELLHGKNRTRNLARVEDELNLYNESEQVQTYALMLDICFQGANPIYVAKHKDRSQNGTPHGQKMYTFAYAWNGNGVDTQCLAR